MQRVGTGSRRVVIPSGKKGRRGWGLIGGRRIMWRIGKRGILEERGLGTKNVRKGVMRGKREE